MAACDAKKAEILDGMWLPVGPKSAEPQEADRASRPEPGPPEPSGRRSPDACLVPQTVGDPLATRCDDNILHSERRESIG